MQEKKTGGLSENAKLFCLEISTEISRFKEDMLKKRPEEIYSQACRIEHMNTIHGLLQEMSREMGDAELEELAAFPGLLAFLYGEWLKTEDSLTEELQGFLRECISGI